jgi:dTDP-4-dehydrorhamnose reductase
MNVLLTGSDGQLARALIACTPPGIRLLARSRDQLDITDDRALSQVLIDLRPSVVINAAAMTDLDLAERHPELAAAANAVGPAVLAQGCRQHGAHLVHVSTDHVFSGFHDRPLTPSDPPNPGNTYGHTKLAGERAVISEAAAFSTIIRTSWLYSGTGKGFLKRILARALAGDDLRVVDDQFGTPTSAASLARLVWKVVRNPVAGVMHWCDYGIASRHDFAVAIVEEAFAAGVLRKLPIVSPVKTHQQPLAAPRPVRCILDQVHTESVFDHHARNWRDELHAVLAVNDGSHLA